MAGSCGVDFGTSNSAVAVAGASGVELVRLEGQGGTSPSAVFYPPRASPLFGRSALRAFAEGEEGRFMRSLKRILGSSLMGQGTFVNDRRKSFESILADFIGGLKSRAEAQAGRALESVVMGRPVHFVDGDPEADARAQDSLEAVARGVGFRHVEFQFEPIAAAFAHERKLSSEKLALIVDIGGGTSDFTLIRLSRERARKLDRSADILANSGVRIGGNDFDRDFQLDSFMPHLGYRTSYGDKSLPLPAGMFLEMSEWSKVNFLYTRKTRQTAVELLRESHEPGKFGRFLKILEDETGHRLLAAVEEGKLALTHGEEERIDLGFIERGWRLGVSREAFDAATASRVAGISGAITECLARAGLGEEAVELVILTGGTTEIPALRRAVLDRFPRVEISEEDKLSSVGLGLGYDGLRRFGAGLQAAPV
ncbi:Hsp70 family protein [Neomegalonema sp.]|uniref:Hsp70 family protein n=1 Tax=Neomegalonema sp. TaxID=2039713 RepID=UPI0026263BBB|nr:Hsp70 family protein [Neomegalonema sp.]MDD2867801.1 Hsp70 family protein [Neomegalonema sp.]